MLIRSGLPLLGALRSMPDKTVSKSTVTVISCLADEVENGQFLSSAMRKFPKIFGDFAVSIVRVGEVSGSLSENLDYLAEELKKKRELKRKIISALIYPLLILLATLGIAGVLSVYVLPKILPIFQSFRAQLPWSTRTLIFFSGFLSHYWLVLTLAAATVFAFFWLVVRLPKAKLQTDRALLHLPLLGQMFRCYYLSNFFRTLGLLLKSEIRIVEAVAIASATTDNLFYKKLLREASGCLERGEKLSGFLQKYPNFFPPLAGQLLLSGEAAGNLSGSLLYVSGILEEDLADLTRNLSVVIEPALMIIMGVLVGFVAISIITPIYGFTQNLHP